MIINISHMKTPSIDTLIRGQLLAALVLMPLTSRAVNVTWDGDTNANNNGTWETSANWSTAVPTTADNAQLLDVTSGTREVTISSGSPQTINKLTITQTTTGAFNVLNLNDNLTISGNAASFAITATAGQSNIVTNIGAGKILLATHSATMTSTFAGTLNLGAGSIFKTEAVGASSDLSFSFAGPINVTGAGAEIIAKIGRNASGAAAFSGAITATGEGSTLTLRVLSSTDVLRNWGTMNFTGNDGSGNSVNLAAGTQFNIASNGNTTNFTNRVSLAGTSGPTAAATMTSSGTAGNAATTGTMNLNGGLTLGAGAKFTLDDRNAVVNLAGTSTMATGSEIRLKYNDAAGQGGAVFANTGALAMDGAAVAIDWTSPANQTSALARRFTNTGTWTLDNGSTVSFVSTNSRPTSGFGVGTNNFNTGTMTVKKGSSVGFQDLFNTGTLNLGSSTAGVSDTTVSIGSPLNTFSAAVLNNGLTPTSTGTANTSTATININGNTYLGRTTAPATIGGVTPIKDVSAYLNNGTNVGGTVTGTGATINIGDGTVPTLFTMASSNALVVNAAGNSINLNSGATLLMKSLLTASTTGHGSTTIANAGTFTQAGKIQLQSAYAVGSRSISTSTGGLYKISGANAVVEAMAGASSGSSVAATAFNVTGGVLQGNTATDRLTFTNSTGSALSTHTSMTIALTDAALAAGNGSNGSGMASIGSMEFVNSNITFGGTSTFTVDIGGTSASGLFDSVTLSGTGATFSLTGTNDKLDLRLVNGFTAGSAETYTVITGTSIVGTFETLLLNGAALTSGEYSVNYTANSISITMGSIPEPSTYGVLLGSIAVGVGLYRRRGIRQ